MEWFKQISRTYGTAFILLTGLGCWVQGFRCFPWTATNYYLKDDLQVAPSQLQFLWTTASLPFLTKPLCGIISDAVYLGGAHRLPYLILACLLQIFCWGSIVYCLGTQSTFFAMTFLLTLSNLGASIADVTSDALIGELGKRGNGELLSFACMMSSLGGLFGNLLSGFALQAMSPQAMCTIFLILATCHLLVCFFVKEAAFGLQVNSLTDAAIPVEDEGAHVTQLTGSKETSLKKRILSTGTASDVKENGLEKSRNLSKEQSVMTGFEAMRKQFFLLYELVKSPQILGPLIWFVGCSAVPSLGGTVFFYQTEVLKISSASLGLAKTVGQFGVIVGAAIYNKYLKLVSFRRLIGTVQALIVLYILSDLVLIYKLNLYIGIPNEVYVMTTSGLVEAIGQFKGLPFVILLSKLCPTGSEGSLLAFIGACQCLAGIFSGYLGVALASYLQIGSGDFSRLPLGIFVQAAITLLPLFWISLLPTGHEQIKTE